MTNIIVKTTFFKIKSVLIRLGIKNKYTSVVGTLFNFDSKFHPCRSGERSDQKRMSIMPHYLHISIYLVIKRRPINI